LTLSSDYIKLEKPQQESQSGCGSSNDDEEGEGEGLETCVSSDIEVLSLPASSSSTTTKTTMIANSNVMQIIKSQEEEEDNNNNTATAKLDIKHMQYVLEARESNILKLNQKNVQLQEANDNLLSELEKFKFEQTDKANSQQVVCDLTNELSSLRSISLEKDRQMEDLRAEGLKLSKRELSLANAIKKLRIKEKESDAQLQRLQSDLAESKEASSLKDEQLADIRKDMSRLERLSTQLERDCRAQQSLIDDLEQKCVSLDNNLTTSYRELAEASKANALKE
jgi:chromosome segregation ATPase